MSAGAERLTRGRQRYTTVSVFRPVLVGRGICFLVVSTDGSFGRRLWFFLRFITPSWEVRGL